MRSSLQKGIGRIVLYFFVALLVVSFAVWGVADFLTGGSQQTLASVGSTQITPEAYQRAYQRQLANYSRQIGRQITTEEARAAGLPQQILDSLISRAALTETARKLGIGISEQGIRDDIMRDESFQDESGNFSRARFDQILNANDLTEPAYVEELRGEILRRQLLTPLAEGAVVPPILIESANRYQNEQRILTYFIIGEEAAGQIAEPAEDQLKSYFEERKSQFASPEYRKITVVTATPDKIRETITVTGEELQQAYEARIDDYRSPERRKIEQISFPSLEAAEKASAELAQGKDFLELAREAGFSQSDIDLGTLTRNDMADPAIAEAAFALNKGEVSKPVKGMLTTAIVRVLEIFPSEEKSFSEVEDQVRKTVVDARVSRELSRLTNAFEDDHTAGMPLAEAAKKHGLELKEVTVDRQGRTPEGKEAPIEKATQVLFKEVFESDVGLENAPVRLEEGAYAWFEVQDIIPSRQKTFEEAREDVTKAWREDQLRTKLVELSQELQKRIEGGEPIADVAKSVNAETRDTKALKRTDVEPGLPFSAIAQAFALPKGGVNAVVGTDRASRVIFQVKDVIDPKPAEGMVLSGIQEQLKQSVAADNLSQFILAARTDLGAQVNQQQFSALTGVEFPSN